MAYLKFELTWFFIVSIKTREQICASHRCIGIIDFFSLIDGESVFETPPIQIEYYSETIGVGRESVKFSQYRFRMEVKILIPTDADLINNS